MEPNPQLTIHQLQLGDHDNFVYVLADEVTHNAVVVDPAWNVATIYDLIDRHSYKLVAVWLTHGHADHTEGVTEITNKYGIPVYLPRQMPAKWRPYATEQIEFDDGDTLHVGELEFNVLHTPGHSPDGSCFLHQDRLFAGDTLFIDGCGRCDLPDSDVDAMYDSIHGRLMSLPDDTIIYPGHDYGDIPYDTLANQRRTNRFMIADHHAAFVRERMG